MFSASKSLKYCGIKYIRSQSTFSTTKMSVLRQVSIGTFWFPLFHLDNKEKKKKTLKTKPSTVIYYDSDRNVSKSL